MSYLLTAPETLAAAATDVDGIAAAIHAANAAAAGRTSGLLAAAGDEVSAAIADLFSAYGDEYQAVIKQASLFQDEFTRALSNAASAYTQAEALNGALLNGMQSLLTQPPTAAAAATLTPPITALIMGGTNNPIPNAKYLTNVFNRYIKPLYPGANPLVLPTPEQFWPVTPDLGNMTYNQSVAKGVSILNNAINAQLAAGNDVITFGYSQSASIVNNQILNLMAAGSPHVNDLSFILAAAGNNPNGGLLSRFPGFYIPFLDVPFNGALPAGNPYETYVYTAQYDGVAHTPQYPLNILADINAVMGYFYVHGNYPLTSAADMANAVLLPTSPGYAGNTQYYMFLTQDLPLLQPIRDIPYAGPVLADLIQPQLRVMVDLGYSDYGYADLPTPAGLINIPNPFNVAYYLAKGTLLAPYGAAVEIGVQAGLWGPEYFPNEYPWVPSINPGLNFYLGPQLSQPPVTALSLLSGTLGDVLEILG
ncbi:MULTISPECIES: PE-PPE domain-containing protein [unclassified Mycobacterium]|uniref:PE family protein n=1 Tax=unclassified Mycobacterium TaxID=2642494 RepID=UPI000F92FD63|nr:MULTISPECIES: PE-PPE domain-containing protein [unclassified Mycobacterium]MDP7704512.1 PE-PPE domain-containing protein [Mycobacterium sp. TY815]MDP7722980.1 PE-PPE domain-containing protein [Mycobacterium sp. TY814]RUP05339.1 MAG: PE-PPE domain-containing protein [Mycobacterium sp.]